MDYTYAMTDNPNVVMRSDGLFIPTDSTNPDYQACLAWLAAGHSLLPTPLPNKGTISISLMAAVDSLVASIYDKYNRFQQEYLLREAAAQTFKDSGYVGDPGVWVTAYAQAVGISNQQAADTILGQATALNGALQVLGSLRMKKYSIKNAADIPGCYAAYNSLVAEITTIAAQLASS